MSEVLLERLPGLEVNAEPFPHLYTLLCYIVTHADINVSLQLSNQARVLARPHYSCFDSLCSRLQIQIRQCHHVLLWMPNQESKTSEPIGVEFSPAVPGGELKEWRLRSRDEDLVKDLINQDVTITAIYFPLIAIILSAWLHYSTITETDTIKRKKFLYLVSGSGTARTPEHDWKGNSTAALGELIRLFIMDIAYPTRDIQTEVVDSGPGLFVFGANVNFIQQALVPLINTKRSELAYALGEDWPARFSLMVTLKPGTVARTTALMSSLRQFRPDYLHVSEVKTFWYGWPNISKLWFGDIEFLAFDSVESNPHTSIDSIQSSLLKDLIEKMIERKQEFWTSCRTGTHELTKFWMRKSFKPVLSVLQVVKSDGIPVYYSGINIEVSMPTGSLCAERNAIGNALAYDPTIRRFDMKAIAVLSLSLEYIDGELWGQGAVQADIVASSERANVADAWDDLRFQDRPTRSQTMRHSTEKQIPASLRALNPINPCGACKEWLKKIALVNPNFVVLTFLSVNCQEVFIRPVLR